VNDSDDEALEKFLEQGDTVEAPNKWNFPEVRVVVNVVCRSRLVKEALEKNHLLHADIIRKVIAALRNNPQPPSQERKVFPAEFDVIRKVDSNGEYQFEPLQGLFKIALTPYRDGSEEPFNKGGPWIAQVHSIGVKRKLTFTVSSPEQEETPTPVTLEMFVQDIFRKENYPEDQNKYTQTVAEAVGALGTGGIESLKSLREELERPDSRKDHPQVKAYVWSILQKHKHELSQGKSKRKETKTGEEVPFEDGSELDLEARLHKVQRWLDEGEVTKETTWLTDKCVTLAIKKLQAKVNNEYALNGLKKFLDSFVTTDAKTMKRGCILYGPPGTGKTVYLDVIIRCGFELLRFMDASETKKGLVGESRKCLDELFMRSEALTFLLCLLVVDEIDGAFPKRDAKQGEDKNADAVSVVLNRLGSGVLDMYNAILVGASNFKDKLDDAVLSRCNIQVYVGFMNEHARFQMIRNKLNEASKYRTEGSMAKFVELAFPDEYVNKLASNSTNWSGRKIDQFLDTLKQKYEKYCRAIGPQNHDGTYMLEGEAWRAHLETIDEEFEQYAQEEGPKLASTPMIEFVRKRVNRDPQSQMMSEVVRRCFPKRSARVAVFNPVYRTLEVLHWQETMDNAEPERDDWSTAEYSLEFGKLDSQSLERLRRLNTMKIIVTQIQANTHIRLGDANSTHKIAMTFQDSLQDWKDGYEFLEPDDNQTSWQSKWVQYQDPHKPCTHVIVKLAIVDTNTNRLTEHAITRKIEVPPFGCIAVMIEWPQNNIASTYKLRWSARQDMLTNPHEYETQKHERHDKDYMPFLVELGLEKECTKISCCSGLGSNDEEGMPTDQEGYDIKATEALPEKSGEMRILDYDRVGGINIDTDRAGDDKNNPDSKNPTINRLKNFFKSLLHKKVAYYEKGQEWSIAIIQQENVKQSFSDNGSIWQSGFTDEMLKLQAETWMECPSCRGPFCMAKNEDKSCKYHPGYLVAYFKNVHKFDRSSTDRPVEIPIHMTLANALKAQKERKGSVSLTLKWTCCQKENELDPTTGCKEHRHLRPDERDQMYADQPWRRGGRKPDGMDRPLSMSDLTMDKPTAQGGFWKRYDGRTLKFPSRTHRFKLMDGYEREEKKEKKEKVKKEMQMAMTKEEAMEALIQQGWAGFEIVSARGRHDSERVWPVYIFDSNADNYFGHDHHRTIYIFQPPSQYNEGWTQS
jgi:hypothetical protein